MMNIELTNRILLALTAAPFWTNLLTPNAQLSLAHSCVCRKLKHHRRLELKFQPTPDHLKYPRISGNEPPSPPNCLILPHNIA
ncbi:Uncharacterized protein APZ42_031059 [Daphnia magna]|uniref:Uncharacterized protein n=1 Tax=Daphnia magna TaxID=35525 RepID=A0A164N6K7_9CRUS|nr:Uncharacterized protein APZ42_031059 [Daphnia magna]